MSQAIKISGFNGLNNVQQSSAFLTDQSGLVTPRFILNADITSDKTLIKRKGYKKLHALINAHSLSKNCSILLCVADNKLCKMSCSGYTEICDVFSDSMSYVEIENYIYMSSPTWTGKYNLLTNSIEDWGINPPPKPQISLISGNLPPGRYLLCYTKQSDGRLSGNSSIQEIEFEGSSRGIEITNYQSSYLCWITDTDGKDFYLADVQNNKIVTQHYNIPLQSLFVTPPPKMSVISYIFGRIWGIKGKKLYYSEPNAFEWFKEANHIPFPDHLVMLTFTPMAIFVASTHNTWVLIGTDPAKMIMKRVGDGTIPGCSETGEFQQSGQEVPTWRHKSILPIWLSPQGFTVGNEHNYLTNLTENRLDFTLGKKAATLQRVVNGQMQILVSMPVVAGTLGDIFKLGRAFIPAPLEVMGSGGVEISGNGIVEFG